MLEVKNLDVFFGDTQVLYDVSFEMQEGEVLALIGSNGSGKSPLLKSISLLLPPKRGSILFYGTPIHILNPFDLIELGICHCPEGRRLFLEMTVEENLDMGSLKIEAKRLRQQTKEVVFEFFPFLRKRRNQAAGTLSSGEQQMLAIGRSLMGLPRLLMLDEPSLGLAPILVKEIFSAIRKIQSGGASILIVEQNVRQTLKIADRAYVLENGRIVLQGTSQELAVNPYVKTAYLGL